jgi:hypothetical protein
VRWLYRGNSQAPLGWGDVRLKELDLGEENVAGGTGWRHEVKWVQ